MWSDWWQGGLLVPVPAAWTWQVWPQPVSLSKAPNPYLPNHFKMLWIESNANVICVMLLHSNKTTNLITSLPLSSPFKERRRGGAVEMGKNKRAGAVFMAFSIQRRRGENIFSSHNPWNHMKTQSALCVCLCVRALGHKKGEVCMQRFWLPCIVQCQGILEHTSHRCVHVC